MAECLDACGRSWRLSRSVWFQQPGQRTSRRRLVGRSQESARMGHAARLSASLSNEVYRSLSSSLAIRSPSPRQRRNTATPLTKDRKNALRASLKSKQAPVESQDPSRGRARCIARLQIAYNGVNVHDPERRKAGCRLRPFPASRGGSSARLSHLDNVHGVPLIGAPAVWGSASNGFTRRGHQDRRHRHGHRLHARRLRRARHAAA